MPSKDSTHHNPYTQGGWPEAGASGAAPGSPANAVQSPTSGSPTAVAHSDAPAPAAQPVWVPPQSTFGALPVPPGVPGTALSAANYVLFRLAARGTADLFVLAPHDRIVYRVYAGGPQHTVVVDANKRQIARVDWLAVPAIQLHGRQMTAPQWLRQLPGRGLLMKIRDTEYNWTFDSQYFYLNAYGTASPPIVVVARTPAGLEIKVLTAVANAEFLENVVVAIIVIQGRRFVGL